MLLPLLLSCLAFFAPSTAFLFAQNKWNGLEVTFGINPLDSNVFASLPRTQSEATSGGWTKVADCDNTGKFRGVRFVKNNDYAVVLLFDVNGYIAGIQCSIAKSGLPSDYPPAKQRGHLFQDDGAHHTLTAYFVDPSTICTTGRSSVDFANDGTGTGLFLQNGSNPLTQSIHIPSQEQAVTHSAWTKGHCFPAMGVHYWYSVSTDMSCDDFQPVFLLYNEGRLTAFGWAMGVGQTSSRFEHPPHASFSAFLNPVPKCLDNYAALSTMHIYMTAHPTQDLC